MASILSLLIAAAITYALFFSDSSALFTRGSSADAKNNTVETHVPTASTNVTESYSLDLKGNGLTSVPIHVFSEREIRHLDLSHNALDGALPAEIRLLSNLEILDISSNHMTGLPAEIGHLSKLRILNISNNNLTGLPHELGNLQNLELLDLSGNAVSKQDLQIIRARLPRTTRVIQ